MARLINTNQLFIHTAKTGGTFFREALNYFGVPNFEIGEKHSSFDDIYSSNEWKQLQPIHRCFGFVRNPLTWYRSRWAYAKMTYFQHKLAAFPNNHPVHNHWMAKVWHDDLNVFVENTLKHYPDGIAYDYFNRMLQIENWNTSGIDVYRYENLVYDTCSIIGTTLHKNISVIDIKNLKPQLMSEQIGGEISPTLKKEIVSIEYKLFEMYY